MTNRENKSDWQGSLISMIAPAIIFIASVGVLYAQVSDLKVMMRETTKILNVVLQRVTAVETKVQFLYDERKNR